VDTGLFADGSYDGHQRLSKVLARHPQLSTYFKFTFIRNPWDRLVSLYHYFMQLAPGHKWWHPKNAAVQKQVMEFGSFKQMLIELQAGHALMQNIHFRPQTWWVCDDQGALLVDYVGRVEMLAESWDHVCNVINFHKPLPRTNTTIHSDYRYYYDEEMWQRAADIYEDDMRRWPEWENEHLVRCKRVHLGCGDQKRPGWINVDVDARWKPDVVAPATRLPFKTGEVTVVESYHLLEHLTKQDAALCMAECHRVLKPGGLAVFELPNLLRCCEMIQSDDPEEVHFGMIGIYQPFFPTVDAMRHKWGWTPETIEKALLDHGFSAVEIKPCQQVRKATPYKRDMRVEATK